MASVNLESSLGDLGLDSLMAVEVRQVLEREYNLVLSMRDIQQLTLRKLQELSSQASPDAGAWAKLRGPASFWVMGISGASQFCPLLLACGQLEPPDQGLFIWPYPECSVGPRALHNSVQQQLELRVHVRGHTCVCCGGDLWALAHPGICSSPQSWQPPHPLRAALPSSRAY